MGTNSNPEDDATREARMLEFLRTLEAINRRLTETTHEHEERTIGEEMTVLALERMWQLPCTREDV